MVEFKSFGSPVKYSHSNCSNLGLYNNESSVSAVGRQEIKSTRKKKSAFTLAEVLITLGIIGVVAAMTLPALIQSHDEKATVSKLKKFYSVLQNAYSLYRAEDYPVVVTPETPAGAAEVANWFMPYMKVAKDCGANNNGGCIYSGVYKYKSGGYANINHSSNSNYYKIVLDDGATMWFRGSGKPTFLGIIFYDVNGKNPPNTWGYDLFEFLIQKEPNRVIPSGIKGMVDDFNSTCAPANSLGYGCAYWVIQQGNMKYLKDHNLTLN